MIKPPFILVSLLGIAALLPLRAGAQEAGTVTQQEQVRAEEKLRIAAKAVDEGDKQYEEKNYDQAVQQYQLAAGLIPDAPYTHSVRARAIQGLGLASVRLAEERITEGRYDDAKSAAKTILKYDPNYRPAVELLAHMEDPDWFNTTVGPRFEDKVHEVQRLFIEAKGFYDTARFDLAYKRCDQILGLDPYNTAARNLQEQITAAKERYAQEAYNETRGLLNWQITKEWETSPRKYINRQAVRIITTTNTNSTEEIQNKLNRIIIPSLSFKDATVREAIDFLRKKSVELDTAETDPTKKGVNIFLKLNTSPAFGAVPAPAAPEAVGVPGVPVAPAPSASSSLGDKKINLTLTNIPLAEALRYICELAGLKTKIDPYAVSVVPLAEPTTEFITKEYKVPPGFLTTGGPTGPSLLSTPPGGGALPGGALGAPGGAVGAPAPTSALGQKPSALQFLKDNGVQFPEGASANFIPSSSKLVVRNTEDNMDLVDRIVDALNSQQPTQVNVESKFLEIQQINYKELSFDYSLGTGNIGKIQYIGGNTASPTTTFPFTNIFGGGQITSGLRTGGEAIVSDAIDNLLNPSSTPPGQAAPATFALAGVVTTAQFQAVFRALNQRKGVDLLSAPSVTTKSGQRAVIEVVVEFRYPTEFNPPQVPNIAVGAVGVGGGYTPVTPTAPTAFETRNTGVTLEVQPTVGADGETIDLDLSPQVVEFDGFVNYGSPVYGPPEPIYSPVPVPGGGLGFGIFGDIVTFPIIGYGPPTVVTQNVINQPIFDTRKVTTSVSVWDGQTVIIGGLVREDVQTVNDKVPGLGDLPIIGQLFRSNVDQHTKRNLVMFVTAHLVNPAGDLVHEEEEKEEDVNPLGPPELPVTPSLPEVPLIK